MLETLLTLHTLHSPDWLESTEANAAYEKSVGTETFSDMTVFKRAAASLNLLSPHNADRCNLSARDPEVQNDGARSLVKLRFHDS